MRTNMLSLEQIHEALPDLEAVVYGPLIEMKFGELEPGLPVERARTDIARMPYCLETTQTGRHFFAAQLGSSAVRHELHAIPDEQHHFLSVSSDPEKLTDDDIIVDPTYLQYLHYENRCDLDALMAQRRSRIFIGVRAAIIDLMYTADFKGEAAAMLYRPQTLIRII